MKKLKKGKTLTNEYRVLQALHLFNGEAIFPLFEIITDMDPKISDRMSGEGLIVVTDDKIKITDKGIKRREELIEELFDVH